MVHGTVTRRFARHDLEKREKEKIKGVTPGGVTPIRRFRITLLPAEGPPLPFRPRRPGRSDHVWAGHPGPARTGLARRHGHRTRPKQRMNPTNTDKQFQVWCLLRVGVHPTLPIIPDFAEFVKYPYWEGGRLLQSRFMRGAAVMDPCAIR